MRLFCREKAFYDAVQDQPCISVPKTSVFQIGPKWCGRGFTQSNVYNSLLPKSKWKLSGATLFNYLSHYLLENWEHDNTMITLFNLVCPQQHYHHDQTRFVCCLTFGEWGADRITFGFMQYAFSIYKTSNCLSTKRQSKVTLLAFVSLFTVVCL